MTRTALATDDPDPEDEGPQITTSMTGSMGRFSVMSSSPPILASGGGGGGITVAVPMVESELRRLISERLLESIRTHSRVGYPEAFVQGMERALEIINAGSLPKRPPQ
jgi:hypothetical protein